jgi:hypothetical protein
MTAVTRQRGHSLCVLAVSGTVFLARRSHTATGHVRAFGRCGRHRILLKLVRLPRSCTSKVVRSGIPECPTFYSLSRILGQAFFYSTSHSQNPLQSNRLATVSAPHSPDDCTRTRDLSHLWSSHMQQNSTFHRKEPYSCTGHAHISFVQPLGGSPVKR